MDIDFDIVIYHQGCPDGIAGAWPFWRENAYRNVRFFGYIHRQPVPDLSGLNVVLVDTCFPYKMLLRLATRVKRILILDHHDLCDDMKYVKKSEHELTLLDENQMEIPNIKFIFDIERSGSQIAWDYVYPKLNYPWFIRVIADRDLWKWREWKSKQISKALFIEGYYTWSKLEYLYKTRSDGIQRHLAHMGDLYLKQEEREIGAICNSAFLTELTTPDGEKYRVWLANCSGARFLRSEIGNRLAADSRCDFAAVWSYDFLLDEWWISLRCSSYSRLNMKEISSKFASGGGHRRASSFVIFGHDGHKLQTFFKILQVPKSRNSDSTLIRDENMAVNEIERPVQD